MAPELPETREVLLDHLLVKLRHISPGQEKALMEQIGKGLSNDELLQLLQSDQDLGDAVETLLLHQQNGSLSLGEAVFARVSQLDSELCAQLTGMLLELPPLRLVRLLHSEDALREAVSSARAEYLRYTAAEAAREPDPEPQTEPVPTPQPDPEPGTAPSPSPSGREELAERLFTELQARHPELAGRLTGMLLELPEHELAALLTDRQQLAARTQQALRALGR